MLGAIALFALASLAITAPGTFAVVLCILVIATFALRAEVKTHHQNQARHKSEAKIPDPKHLIQWLAIAEATGLLKAAPHGAVSASDGDEIFVAQLLHTYDAKALQVDVGVQDLSYFRVIEDEELKLAMRTLLSYEPVFRVHGLRFLFVSLKPYTELLESIRPGSSKNRSEKVILSAPGKSTHKISVVFLRTRFLPVAVDQMASDLRKASFELLDALTMEIPSDWFIARKS
jgi:hypothetical protein